MIRTTVSMILTTLLLIGIHQRCMGQSPTAKSQKKVSAYYPPTNGGWAKASPTDAGWDAEKLKLALEYAGEQKSSGVVILLDGKILAEQFWNPKRSFRYRSMLREANSSGQSREDVASVQKSVAAVLLGIAIDKKLVTIDDPVHQHLGTGWSRASEQQESQITLKHVVSMTTGLNDQLKFQSEPGKRWRYNTNAYSRIMNVLEVASKMDRNQLTRKWLSDPIGMTESEWDVRPFAKDDPKTNRHGFVTSARDLARFGLLVQNEGKWKKKQIVSNGDYWKSMVTSSQTMNSSYGYLWWLNGQPSIVRQARTIKGPLLKPAPEDTIAALGALGRKVYVVPSMKLVVTRLGDAPGAKFDNEFWERLMAAAPEK
ncbi:MAG: serine hydrolase [Planctomycetota bacterium]